MPDGLSSVDYLRANLPQVEALKRKQLFEAMKSATPQAVSSRDPVVNKLTGALGTDTLPPRINIGSNGSLTGGEQVAQARESPPTSNLPSLPINLPTPNITESAEPQRVYQGVDTTGMTGSTLASARLRGMQSANDQGLNFRVTPDAVEYDAPKPKHLGLGAHIKAALKDAVINAGEYARTHPGASAGELLGAGGAGAVVGGVSPDAGDALTRRYQIQQQEGDVANQLGLEGRQAQVQNEQNKPLIDLARIRAENQRTQDQADREDARLKETARHNQATETERANRPRSERPPILRERKNRDGTISTLRSDDNGKTWNEVSDLTSQPPDKPQGEDYGQLRDWNYKKQHEAEDAAKELRRQADLIKQSGQYDLDAGQKAQKEDLLKRAGESEQNALKYRDEGDKAAVKVKVAGTATIAPSPSTHGVSFKAWKALPGNENKSQTDFKMWHDNDPKYKNYKMVP